MKTASALFFILVLACVSARAEEAATKCITAESEITFQIKDVVPSDADLAVRRPVVEYDEGRRPVRLKWVPKKHDTLSTSEKIAEVNGKEVRRFVFSKAGGNRNGDGVVCVWFGLQMPAPNGGLGFRPFLVFEGDDQLRWWESFCGHTASDGFTVELEYTVKGTGVHWRRSIVQFKDDSPSPLRFESGGRGKVEPEIGRYR